MKVEATVVSHGHCAMLERCLKPLRDAGVSAIVCENVPDGSAQLARRLGARVVVNEAPRSFAANQNALILRSKAEFALVLNPDVRVQPSCVNYLLDHAEKHPRAGILGPRLLDPDGSLQRSRRRFPTVVGTLVRRTPLRLALGDLERAQPQHYLGDLPASALECDWMLGACLRKAR